MRTGSGTGTSGLQWIIGDHLGSTTKIANYDGTLNSQRRYRPWEEARFGGAMASTFAFTGQRQEVQLGGTDGLYDYGARWYDAALGRWLSPDSIIPEAAQGVQAWSRYTYVNNAPTRYQDQTGHSVDCAVGEPGCDPGGDPVVPVCPVPKPVPLPYHNGVASTNPVYLRGGPGAGSYAQKAYNSYTGFSTSGGVSWADPIELASEVLVWVRDNTSLLSRTSTPDGYGVVYYNVDRVGLWVTGFELTNLSDESIAINYVSSSKFSSLGQAAYDSDKLYPIPGTYMSSQGYGVAYPSSSAVIMLRSHPLTQGYYMKISVRLSTSSGRWGTAESTLYYEP